MVDRNQDPQCRLTIFTDQWDQLFSSAIAFASAVGLQREERANTGHINPWSGEIGGRQAELHQIFLRKVNPAHGNVFFNIANNIDRKSTSLNSSHLGLIFS